jgi:hypothetical protein
MKPLSLARFCERDESPYEGDIREEIDDKDKT